MRVARPKIARRPTQPLMPLRLLPMQVALALHGFDQVQVLVPAAPDQEDVADLRLSPRERLDRDVVAVLDLP
jgi:hypothetical protein